MTIGWRTVDVGERAVVYNLAGAARIIDGPQQLYLWREKFVKLAKYTAGQNEYLEIRFRNGFVECRPGPCMLFLNPVQHHSITLKPALALDSNEALVVYRHDNSTGSVERYIIYGPTQFIQKPHEWLHSFVWHGTDPENKTHIIPGARRFTKLCVVPDQFYYNVDNVRTADDGLVRIKLMVFYELQDVEKMLANTQDPIGDIVSTICADVMAFSASKTYLEFVEKSSQLNDLDIYEQLIQRCKSIGYEVTKIIFRGYFTVPKIQAMHDQAITKRTELQLAYEGEQQNQRLKYLAQETEMKHLTVEHSLATEKLLQMQSLEKAAREHSMQMKMHAHEKKLDFMAADDKAKLQTTEKDHQEKLLYLRQLAGMGVDLTPVLLSENPTPDRVIKIVSEHPNLHFHQN